VLLTDFIWNLALSNTEIRELLTNQSTNQPISQTQRNQTQTNLTKPNEK
jgi:hypothetical protein